jgi:large-conductance mechanosensitive channel
MIFFRKFLSAVLLMIIWFGIVAAAIFFIFSETLRAERVKEFIASDGGYEQIAESVKNQIYSTLKDSPIKDREGLVTMVTPEFVREKAEFAIDQYYNWAAGKPTATSISISELNQILPVGLKIDGIEIDSSIEANFSDIALPMPASESQRAVNIFYRLVYGGYYWIIVAVAILTIILILLRFSALDRLLYFFWIFAWPAISFLVQILLLIYSKRFLNKDLYQEISPEYGTFLLKKSNLLINNLIDCHLKILFILVAFSLISLVVYLIVRKHSKKTEPPEKEKPESSPPDNSFYGSVGRDKRPE